jgi:ABC-type nitrate/sulfonate/bicarbonate transport system substrate-binding protein
MKKGRAILAVLTIVVLVVASMTALIMFNDSARQKTDLIITYSNKVDYEPLIIANELDLYSDNYVNATAYVVSGGIQSAEAVITGAADLGAMGDSPALQLLDKSSGAKIVARYAYGEGMHRLIAYDDIVLPTDLEEMKVGLQSGSSSHAAFLQWANANGVNLDNVTIVPLSPSDMADAMRTRQVDAIMASEPYPINVIKACGDTVHELGNSSGLGNTFPLVLVASESALANKREAIYDALSAIEEAIEMINENSSAMAVLCANKTGLTASDQLGAMSDLTYQLGFNETDVAGLNMTGGFLLANSKISAIPDIPSRLDKNEWTKDYLD